MEILPWQPWEFSFGGWSFCSFPIPSHFLFSTLQGFSLDQLKSMREGAPSTLRVELGNHPALNVSPGPPAQGLKEIRQWDRKSGICSSLLFVFVGLCAWVYLLQFGTSCPEHLETKTQERKEMRTSRWGGPGGGAKGIRKGPKALASSISQTGMLWSPEFTKVVQAGLALQGGALGTTDLVRGPQGYSFSSPCGRESKGGVRSPLENIW